MDIDHKLSVCKAGGVEIVDFPKTLAPRRQQHQTTPTLEDYCYVPYLQTSSTISEDLHMNGRNLHCLAMENDGESVRLIEGEMRKELNQVDKDSFQGSLSCDELLQPFLDLVLENIMTHEVVVIEMVADFPRLQTKVIPLLAGRPTVVVDYICALCTETGVWENPELFEDVQTVCWDLEGKAPKEVSAANLIIASEILLTKPNVAAMLVNTAEAIGENSFILIEENTLSDKDQEVGEQYSIEQWMSFFQDAKLECVAQKSGRFSTSIFLLRKRRDSTVTQEILRVDDLSFSWVEDVKSAMLQLQMKPKGCNLWLLVSSQPVSGIVGLVNCLRREPGGARIR